jgi:hypothetical protein
MLLAATLDARIDAARATADRKSKDFVGVIATDYTQDNEGVTLYFSKVMSIPWYCTMPTPMPSTRSSTSTVSLPVYTLPQSWGIHSF